MVAYLGAGVGLIVNVVFVMALYAAPIFLLVGTSLFMRRIYHRRDRRNPLSKGLLRTPGYTLQKQLDQIRSDMLALLASATPFPLLALALYQTRTDKWSFHPAFIALLGTLPVIYAAIHLAKLVKQARNTRLGMEAEMAAGQELSLLMKDGFDVYHDVPGDTAFNIDHVVVGPSGVFAVETKGRAKPVKENGHVLRYEDEVLKFPGWQETAPIEQAKRNADWLKKWLSSAVGEQVEARPVLIFPGWYVERSSRTSVAVISGSNNRNCFLKQCGATLPEQLIKRISHQLDQRCRDAEVTSYKPLQS